MDVSKGDLQALYCSDKMAVFNEVLFIVLIFLSSKSIMMYMIIKKYSLSTTGGLYKVT